MGDPGFDFGTVSITSGFTEPQDEEMLQAYCHGLVPYELRARMVMYKAVCDFCWALWGFHQSALGVNLLLSRNGQDVVARSKFKIQRFNGLTGDGFSQHQLKILSCGCLDT